MSDNLSHALYMAFAVMVFVIACSYSIYMVNVLNTTAKTLVYRLDETNYYDSLTLTSLIDTDSSDESKAYRVVGIETIIPTLYRYYSESFCVKIVDENGDLLQMFDTTVEGDVNTASSKELNTITDTATKNKYAALLSLYGDSNKACYMFGAPWLGSTNKDNKKDARERIDLYINGGKEYIGKVLVDYSGVDDDGNGKYLNYYKDYQFKEIFSQYNYEGDTVSSYDDEGEVLETLTGTKQTSTKIVITYQLIR